MVNQMAWKWENSKSTTVLPVDFCRDRYVFDIPLVSDKIDDYSSEDKVFTWQRGNDQRYFSVPTNLITQLSVNNNLFRDIIACISQLYLNAKCPDTNTITTSIRGIANSIGISINGKKFKEIENILTFARYYTIHNQLLRRVEEKKIVEYSTTFSFIKSVLKETMINGKEVNPRGAKTHIKLNDIYAAILSEKRLPKAPIPVAALQAANKAPRRLITPAKNLIYRLAARVPRGEVEYSLLTLKDILGFREKRRDRLIHSIENILEIIYPVMINDFKYDSRNEKYILSLSGTCVQTLN